MDFRKHVLRTPLIPYDSGIYLKPENLQAFGSYKIRGIASTIAAANPAELKRGLVAASAGNMAQAVAFAARELEIPCRIYLPETAPEVKKSAIRRLGAQMIEKPFEEVWDIVRNGSVQGEDGVFIHPAFTESLTRGYASIADEVLEDLPDFDAIVIPFGVGGLSLGIARRLKELRSPASVILAEPETAAPMNLSISMNQPSSVDRRPSFIDAIGTPEVLPRVFEELKTMIAESIVVTEGKAKSAVISVFQLHRMVIEGAGACALAAAEQLASEGKYRKIVCVLSGGNIDPEFFGKLLGGFGITETRSGFSSGLRAETSRFE